MYHSQTCICGKKHKTIRKLRLKEAKQLRLKSGSLGGGGDKMSIHIWNISKTVFLQYYSASAK